MAHFNLENYETVEDRLVKFWEQHSDGRILTSIHYYDDTRILVKAEIYFNREDDRPVATGYAEELRGASPVNRTSHAENAETSAIGRGLANCGYATKGSRPSREEMEKVQRGDSLAEITKPNTPKQNVNDVLNKLQETFSGSEVVDTPAKSVAIKNPGEPASPKQIGMIRAIMATMGMNKDDQKFYVEAILGHTVTKLDEITKGEASLLITDLKK
jgi:hypothetical protein